VEEFRVNCDKCGGECEIFRSIGGYRCYWCRGCNRMIHVEKIVNGDGKK